jgi:peptidyl-prolyl cis-trans isomerase B (cyclophilin B)
VTDSKFKESSMAQQQWSAPPAMEIDVAKDCAVSIETNRGTIELTLYPQHAPRR